MEKIDSFFQYVKMHAINIYVYLESTNVNDVNDRVISQQKKSNKWYTLGFQELYMFMKVTIEGFKIPDGCKSDIKSIGEISVHTIGQFKDLIKEKYEKNSSINDILSIMKSKSDYVTQLNQDILKNCVDAIHFINKYILFLKRIDGLPYKLETNNDEELCKNLDNVFNAN
jgi:hypothetical protein